MHPKKPNTPKSSTATSEPSGQAPSETLGLRAARSELRLTLYEIESSVAEVCERILEPSRSTKSRMKQTFSFCRNTSKARPSNGIMSLECRYI